VKRPQSRSRSWSVEVDRILGVALDQQGAVAVDTRSDGRLPGRIAYVVPGAPRKNEQVARIHPQARSAWQLHQGAAGQYHVERCLPRGGVDVVETEAAGELAAQVQHPTHGGEVE
jgi:hypothetical protein